MVYRVFVEKKEGLDNEAKGLLNEARNLLGMERLENVRLFNRYDAENITEDLFRYAVKTVFSEPQLDTASPSVQLPGAYVFGVEALPGQFDQRADSAAQCIQIISQGERPLIRTAKVYALYGALTEEDIREFKKYVINPVECREASLDVPETLAIRYDIPTEVATLTGFTKLSRDELAVLDGGKCILQLRGVRPFLSDKYDLTQHPNYKLTSDYDPKNTFDIEKYLNRKEKIQPGDEFIVVDADSLPSA